MVSLELRVSAVTDRADVVFPVAAVAEKQGTFVNWEGRPGSFTAALSVPSLRTDLEVLAALADEMDVHLGLPDEAAARRELTMLTQSPALSPALASAARRPRSGRVRRRRRVRSASWASSIRVRAMRCWPPGIISSTSAGCRTASRIWPARRAPPSRGCRRRPQRKPARPMAARSPWPPATAQLPFPWRSQTCLTASSGCRRTRPAASSGRDLRAGHGSGRLDQRGEPVRSAE